MRSLSTGEMLIGGASLVLLLGCAAAASGSDGASAPSPSPKPPAPKPPSTDLPRDDAAKLARRLAEDIRAHGKQYTRETCVAFQRAVKIDDDGLYGVQTAAALARYVSPAPAPLFTTRPTGTTAPTLSKLSTLDLALRLSVDIYKRQYDYDRSWCRDFQAAVGLPADGIYGPATAAKLDTFTAAPPPLFVSKASTAASKSASADDAWNDPYADDDDGGGGSDAWSNPYEELIALDARALAAARAAAQGGQVAGELAGEDECEGEVIEVPFNLDRARSRAMSISDHVRAKGERYDRDRVRDYQADAGIRPDGVYGEITRSSLAYFGVRNPPPALFAGGPTEYRPPA